MKLLLIILVSFPLTSANAGTTDIGSNLCDCTTDGQTEGQTADDGTDPQPKSTDSPDLPANPADPDEEPTSSEPTPIPSLVDRLSSNSCPELTTLVLQLSKHQLLIGVCILARPNKFSSKPRAQQASLLRLARTPSSDMGLLATLDQAHAPPLS